MTSKISSMQQPFDGSPERIHFQWLQQGRLRLLHCSDCERPIFYPRSICPHCGTPNVNWRDSRGRGTIYSVTVVRRTPKAGGGDYNVALVDLDDGVRLMSRVDGVAPDAVRIGMRVRAEILPAEAGDPLLIFRIEETGHD